MQGLIAFTRRRRYNFVDGAKGSVGSSLLKMCKNSQLCFDPLIDVNTKNLISCNLAIVHMSVAVSYQKLFHVSRVSGQLEKL